MEKKESAGKAVRDIRVGIMKLDFTPEPSRWMMLLAGASVLGLLHRAHRRVRAACSAPGSRGAWRSAEP
jgi:hypothetical protein